MTAITTRGLVEEVQRLTNLLDAAEQLRLAERVRELETERSEMLLLFAELRANHPNGYVRGERCGVSQLLPGAQTTAIWDKVDALLDTVEVAHAE